MDKAISSMTPYEEMKFTYEYLSKDKEVCVEAKIASYERVIKEFIAAEEKKNDGSHRRKF